MTKRSRQIAVKKTREPFLPPFHLASRAERRHFCGLLLALVTVYCLTFNSVPISNIDDQLMLTSAVSLIETGKISAPSRFATKKIGGQFFGKQAESGEVYSKYPPGYPLLLVLFVPLARSAGLLIGSVAADVILCLPSVLALAATALVLWRSALRLRYSIGVARLLALGFALGSFAWPYAGINWSEPYQALCIASAFYCLLAATDEEQHWRIYSVAGGCALGYAILIKATLGLLAPILVLGALAAWKQQRSLKDALPRTALFAAPALVASVCLLVSNYFRFGAVEEFGYRQEAFTATFLEGLYGLTLGPRKGIAWFFPLALLAPVGACRLARRPCKWVAALLSLGVLVQITLISKWHMFEGGNCWGPRLLMPVVPFLALLAGAALDSKWTRRAGVALVILGVAVNSLGALINYQAFYIAARSANIDYERLDPWFSQLPGHFWLLAVEASTPLTAPTESDNPRWRKPPWVSKYPEAVPRSYSRPDQAILNPWPLRLALPNSRWKRGEIWYMRALLEAAVREYEQGEMNTALTLLDRGLKLDNRSKQFLAAKGMVYSSLENLGQALSFFDRSLEADPQYDLGLYGRGLVLEALGNSAAARDAYSRLLESPLNTLDKKEIKARLERLAP